MVGFLAPLAIAVRVMMASARNLVKGLVVRGFMRNRQGTTGINIDLKIKDTKVKKKLRNVDRDINRIVKRALGRAAEFGRAGIVERTKQGLDFKKRSFVPYTPKYKKHRTEHGRSARPDLIWSGQMLAQISTLSMPDKASIMFLNPHHELIAIAQHFGLRAKGIKNPRPFFRLSSEQEKKIVDIIGKELKTRLRF